MRRLTLALSFALFSSLARAQEAPEEQQKPFLPPCDILAKLAEPDPTFDLLELKLGEKTYQYYETRRGKRKKYRRPEMEIGLRVLRLDTCTTEVVVINKKGSIPVSPDGWHIQVDVRHNGIQWNGPNSQFDIEVPLNTIVLANKIPDVEELFTTKTVRGKDGKSRKVRVSIGWEVTGYKFYGPYTWRAHQPEVVTAGDTYLWEVVDWAFADLRERGVRSPVLENRPVVDLIKREWIRRLPLAEQMDFGESSINSQWEQWSAERVLVMLALNRERTHIYNCNYAGACGLYQFTDNGKRRRGKWRPGTYEILVKKFPDAGLNPDFTLGAQDHRNIAKAAILHHVMILEEHVKSFGIGILESQFIEFTLGVGYNGGYGKSNRTAIAAAYKKNDKAWWRKLRKREAREYVIKLEFAVRFTPNGAPLPDRE